MTTPLAALAAAVTAAALLGPSPHPAAPQVPWALVHVQSTDVANQLRAYVAFCAQAAKPEYRADCLAERFTLAAETLGRYGATAELYRALKRAARDLSAVSRTYASTTAAPLILSSAQFTTLRPIQPIARENLARATTAATEVLQEAELTLLRSATRAPEVSAFTQVAAIIGTAKVLLRAG